MDSRQRVVPEHVVAQRVFRRELDGLPRSSLLTLYQFGLLAGGGLILTSFTFFLLGSFAVRQLLTPSSILIVFPIALGGGVIFTVSLILHLKAMRKAKVAAKLAEVMPVEDVALVLIEKNEWLWSAEIVRQLFIVKKATQFAPLYLAAQFPAWILEPNYSILRGVQGVERLAKLDSESRKFVLMISILIGFPFCFLIIGITGWLVFKFNLNGHPVTELLQVSLHISIAGAIVYIAATIRQKRDSESEAILSQLSNGELLKLNGGRLGMLARNIVKARKSRNET